MTQPVDINRLVAFSVALEKRNALFALVKALEKCIGAGVVFPADERHAIIVEANRAHEELEAFVR